MVLRWSTDATDLRMLARDACVSIPTSHRCARAIDVIAAHALDLPEVLVRGQSDGWAFVCLDVSWTSAGFPVWTSEVEPGSTHDITAARLHVLGALPSGENTSMGEEAWDARC